MSYSQSEWLVSKTLQTVNAGGALEKKKFSYIDVAAAAKSLQSCPTLCDSRDGSPPGSPTLMLVMSIVNSQSRGSCGRLLKQVKSE